MVIAIAAADVLIRTVGLPNPAAVTLLGVVAAAFVGGTTAGLIGAVLAFASAVVWFYPVATHEDQWRTATILVSGVLMALLVGILRRRSDILLRQQVGFEKERQHAAERERYLEDLRRSEQRNRAFFELAGAGFAEVDAATGRYVRVNNALCELTGYAEEELLTKTFLDITHPDDRERCGDEYRDAKAVPGTAYETDKRYVCKDGQVKWVHTSIRVVHDSSGSPAISAGIIIDTTRAELAKQALLEANAKLRRLVDSNIIGVIVANFDGTLVEVNDAFLAVIGYSREDVFNGLLPWREITPTEHLPLDEQALREAKERGACTPYEKEYIRKDGTRVPVLIGFAIVEHSPEQYIAFVLDLTQQKAAEAREHAARAEAERANRAKDEFLAVVSHELRTPMTSIVGWSTMLQGSSIDEATRATGWRLLLDAVRLEARLIDDLLDFSRAASGKLLIEAVDLDLRGTVQAALGSQRIAAEARNLEVAVNLSPQPVIVRGDEQRLYQVAANVISNAIKFTAQGGRIEIEVARSDGEALFRVRDSGRGIKPEFLPHVFDWFAQEDASSTRETGGLGLGLAIVRHIVGIHGGRVDAFSEGPDRGSEFVVHLPLVPEAPAETSTTDS